MRLRNAFKSSVFEVSKLVSTKTLLLKHYYRRQGQPRVCKWWFSNGGSSSGRRAKSPTPCRPQAYLWFTSSLPLFYLLLTPCSAGNLEPRFGNHSGAFYRVILPRVVRHAIALRVRMRGTGVRGHVGVWGGFLLFSPTVCVGSGGERRDTHTHTGTHTHTQRNVHADVAPTL